LTEQRRAALDPMLGHHVSVQQHGQYEVGRVTSGGQLTATFAGLVHRTLVAPRRRVDLRLSGRFDADDGHRVVQDPIVLFFQYSAVAIM